MKADDFQTKFQQFWDAYPRRDHTPYIQGRGRCEKKVWQLIHSGRVSWDQLIGGAKAYARCDLVVKRRCVRFPLTWLTNDGWADDYGAAITPQTRWERPVHQWAVADWDAQFGGDPSKTWRRDHCINNWNPAKLGPMPPHPQSHVPDAIFIKYQSWFVRRPATTDR